MSDRKENENDEAEGKTMIQEHDCIVLTQDLPDERLHAGDVGTVVHIHGEGKGYDVEFMMLTGQTIAVATVLPSQLQPVMRELGAARPLKELMDEMSHEAEQRGLTPEVLESILKGR